MAITNHWRSHIAAWQGSGLKQSDYCRQHNISYKTFAARLSDFRRVEEKEKPLLIPVTVTDSSDELTPEPNKIILHCVQGHRLELPGSISAHWLSTLLRGLV